MHLFLLARNEYCRNLMFAVLPEENSNNKKVLSLLPEVTSDVTLFFALLFVNFVI